MPKAATATRPTPVATSASNGSTATLDKIEGDEIAPLWEYQQVRANYRFMPANNPLGFLMQMAEADQYGHLGPWKAVTEIPAFAVKPLLVAAGLVPNQIVDMPTANSGRVAPIARSGAPSKVSGSRA